ncbi:MAG: hypothetical protein U0P30_09585 [Vicinamibacterales bacterium]
MRVLIVQENRRLLAQRVTRMLSHDYVTNETLDRVHADHRAGDGAVLAVVNALRFASTRPATGPLGIDDVYARHGWQLRNGRRVDDASNGD